MTLEECNWLVWVPPSHLHLHRPRLQCGAVALVRSRGKFGAKSLEERRPKLQLPAESIPAAAKAPLPLPLPTPLPRNGKNHGFNYLSLLLPPLRTSPFLFTPLFTDFSPPLLSPVCAIGPLPRLSQWQRTTSTTSTLSLSTLPSLRSPTSISCRTMAFPRPGYVSRQCPVVSASQLAPPVAQWLRVPMVNLSPVSRHPQRSPPR